MCLWCVLCAGAPEQPRRLEPLKTCARPIRVGLSKRAKTKHLHRPRPYKWTLDMQSRVRCVSVNNLVWSFVMQCSRPRGLSSDLQRSCFFFCIKSLLFFPECLRFPYILVPPLSKDVWVHKISWQGSVLHIVQARKIFRFLMAKHLDLYVFIYLLIYCIYRLLSSWQCGCVIFAFCCYCCPELVSC